MKTPNYVLTLLAFASNSAVARDRACPVDAVFLALSSEVRGYAASAHDTVAPCQAIAGIFTGLGSATSMAFGTDGSLHVAQFLTNGIVDVFASDATGDVRPAQALLTSTNDLVSIAVDSAGNDLVLSVRQGGALLRLTPGTASTPPGVQTILRPLNASSVAIDRDNHLLVAGWDETGAAAVNTFDLNTNESSPPLIRTLSLSLSVPIVNIFLDAPNLNIALDPATQELYVYTNAMGGQPPRISVYPAGASGTPSPIRTISGPSTGIGAPGSLGTSKISVGAGGRLFVAEPGNRILVFNPGSRGDTQPDRIIQDSDPASAARPQGGIGMRSFARGNHAVATPFR